MIILGNIRQTHIKSVAIDLVKKFPEKFTGDFQSNKENVDLLVTVSSKLLRNRIAGYITRYVALDMWFLGVNQNQVDPFLSNIPIFILYGEMFLTGEFLFQYKTLSNPSERDSSFSSMTTNQGKAKQTSSSHPSS